MTDGELQEDAALTLAEWSVRLYQDRSRAVLLIGLGVDARRGRLTLCTRPEGMTAREAARLLREAAGMMEIEG